MLLKFKQFGALLNRKAKRLRGYTGNAVFIFLEYIKTASWSDESYSILFSVKLRWDEKIKVGFRNSNYHLHFEKFTPATIAAHDLVIPLTMEDLRYLDEYRSVMKDQIMPVPCLEAIELCDDKLLFYQSLVKSGFSKNLPVVGKDLAFPYILKKRTGENGDNCFIISDSKTEQEHLNLISDPEYICQEIIKGTKEYATHILFRNGKIIKALNIRYLFSAETVVKGKDKYLYRSPCKPRHLDLLADMLKSIQFEGLCCFNYKESAGIPYVFEVNPRFGGSLCSFFFLFMRGLKRFPSPEAAVTHVLSDRN